MSANPDNTFLQLLQRLGQQKDYTLRQLAIARDPAAAGLDRAKATFAVETTPLQVILGLGMEGANNVAKAATGAFLGGAGALGNLTGPQDLSGPDPTGLQHAIAQAHAAPTSGDFFQRLLQLNEAGARGNELTTGLLNTLLDPTNLIGTGEGSAAKKGFQAVASKVDEPALLALARRAVANGADPAALHPTDLFNAIDPADPARLDLAKALYPAAGQRGNVPARDLLPGVGISPRTGKGGARGLGPALPPEPTPLTPQGAQEVAAPLLDQLPLAQAADAPGGAQAAPGALDNGAAVLQKTPEIDNSAGPLSAIANSAPAGDLARMDLLRGKDLQRALDDLLTYNYGSAAKRVVGNIVGKGHTFSPDYRVLDPQGQDVTRSLLDYLLRRSSLDEAGRAALGKELFPNVTRAGDRAATPPPVADLATIHGPADLIDPPDAQDNLDRLRSLIVGEAQRVGTMYPPNDPQFYLRRIPTLTEGELPGFFRQLQQEGTLHFDPRNGYSVAADGPFMGGPMPDLNGTTAQAAQALGAQAPNILRTPEGQPFLHAGTAGKPAEWLAQGNQDVQDYVNFAYRNRANALARGLPLDPTLPGGIGLPGAPADALARFSGTYEGQLLHDFGDGDVGWKLHLNVKDWQGAQQIADFLDKNGIGYKIGRAADEKGMTVYLGARDNYDKVAQVLDRHFGDLIAPPKGTPQGDERVIGNIFGRFDTHAVADMHDYGINGRPLLKSAPGDPAAGDAEAARRYGTFYTGTRAPDLNAAPAIAGQATPAIDQAATGGDTLGLLPRVSRPGAINSGAVLGAFGGYGAADTTDQNRQDDLGGIVGGALLGGLTGGAVTAPGAARFLRFAGTLGKEALAAQKDAFATGETKLGWRQLSGLWTVQQTATLRNLLQEYGSSLGFLANSGVRRQAVNENIRSMVDLRNAGARDPHATLPQAVQDKLAAIGRDQPVYAGGKRANQPLPANYQGANRASGYVLDLGHSFGNVMGHLEKQINPLRSAIAEAGFALASPLAGVPAAGVALGALKGLTRPAQQAVYTTINDIITLSFRSAVWEDAFDRQLAQNAGDFLGLVKQTTGRDLPLSADGLFSPADVRAQLQGVAPEVADNLARHWGELSQEAVKVGEDRAKQVFGDFSNASNAEKAFRTVVPFSSWVLRAIPRTVQLAMDHPAFTLAVLGLYADDAARARREGRPGYQVGTVPVDSNTPVIGKVADVLTGGHGGTARLNPLGSFLPVPGAAFADEGTGGPQTPYQSLEGLLGKTGFSFNPVVQAVAYAMNWDYQRPGALSRTSNYEQALGGPDLPSIVNGPLDYVRKLNGGSVSNLTPEDRRLAQLFYERYGKTINDPSMAQQAADTLNPNDPLRREAAREAAQQGVARNTASLVSPVGLSASTDTEQAAAAARAADNAQQDQAAQAAQADPIAAMVQQKQAQDQAYLLQIMQQNYPTQYALMRQRGEIPGDPAQQPLLTLNRGADQQGRAYQALAAWEAQNTTLAYLAPSYYAAQRLALKKALGLPTTPGN